MFSNRPPETNGSNSIAESIRKSWFWRLVIHDVNSYGILWDLHLNPSWRITIVSTNLQLTSTEHLMFIQYTSLHMVRKIINIYGYKSKSKAPIHTLNPQANPYPRSISTRRWSRPIHTSGSLRANPYPNFDATPYIYNYIYNVFWINPWFIRWFFITSLQSNVLWPGLNWSHLDHPPTDSIYEKKLWDDCCCYPLVI